MAHRLGGYTGMCQAAAGKLTPKGSIYRAGDSTWNDDLYTGNHGDKETLFFQQNSFLVKSKSIWGITQTWLWAREGNNRI